MKWFQNILSMEGKVWKPEEDDEKRIGNKSYEKKKYLQISEIECYNFVYKLCLKNCIRPRKYLYMQLSDFTATPDNKGW